MRTVWKYEISAIHGEHIIDMPKGARVVHVEHQSRLAEIVSFWAEVDDSMPTEPRGFVVVLAGHTILTGARYVGTDCVTASLVLHLYETTSPVVLL